MDTMSTIEYYMGLAYRINLEPIPEEDGGGWLATIPELKGCMSDGETPEEAIKNLQDAKFEWLMEAIERGITISLPCKSDDEEYSGKFTLRLPKSMHKQLAQEAKEEGVSLNQYILHLISYNKGQRNVINELMKEIKSYNKFTDEKISQMFSKYVEVHKDYLEIAIQQKDNWNDIDMPKLTLRGGNKRW
ncbi:type II toxin-antitoxin system HicB family antitoxin [Anoxybacillus ayderensis]|uniref:type II toxin-antitoxin system HicB family antitoxin n=1 Tax=Anoxybacillus ayderensis TaxID=265546 RepID=UPI002E24F549|nr:toxin-antitoxin system HicB family antitoxin [Anoxybacillus ayderensis]